MNAVLTDLQFPDEVLEKFRQEKVNDGISLGMDPM